MERPWRWLESTRDLQREAFGLDPDELHDDPDGQARTVKENVLAAIVELVELLDEVKWKYWSHEEAWVRRDRVLKEAVDVGHFLGNILVGVGITDDEYEEAYQTKQQENRDRQENSYVSRQAEEKQ
jgi:dimeric dUTPase (all-alpha-NTP-PPase superfamily)